MRPTIYETVKATSPATALLGTNPTRFYSFGEAPADVQKPYAVWQTVGGFPENYLDDNPDMDSYLLQIDVYALTATSARAVAEAIRNAVQGVSHITSWRGESRDPDTKNYNYSFDVDWFQSR
jgi:hypothetical protein